MAQARRKKGNGKNITHQVSHGLREGALLILGAIAIFLLVSLVSYEPADPGWSNSGEVARISNAGGIIGAWLADILLYLFGYLAYLLPIMVGYSGWLVYRGHTRAWQRYLERPGGCRQPCRCKPVPAGPVPHRRDAVYRHLLAGGDGLRRQVHTDRVRLSVRAGQRDSRTACRAQGAQRARGGHQGQPAEDRQTQTGAHRTDHQQDENQRPQGARAAGAPVRPAGRFRAAAAGTARRTATAKCRLFRVFTRGHVAPGRDETAGFQHRGRGRRRQSGPGDHPLRARSRPGRQGQPDLQSCQGHRPRTVRHQRTRGRGDTRQVRHRPGDPQREPRHYQSRRNPQHRRIRILELAADPGAGQGHQRAPVRASRSASTPWC